MGKTHSKIPSNSSKHSTKTVHLKTKVVCYNQLLQNMCFWNDNRNRDLVTFGKTIADWCPQNVSKQNIKSGIVTLDIFSSAEISSFGQTSAKWDCMILDRSYFYLGNMLWKCSPAANFQGFETPAASKTDQRTERMWKDKGDHILLSSEEPSESKQFSTRGSAHSGSCSRLLWANQHAIIKMISSNVDAKLTRCHASSRQCVRNEKFYEVLVRISLRTSGQKFRSGPQLLAKTSIVSWTSCADVHDETPVWETLGWSLGLAILLHYLKCSRPLCQCSRLDMSYLKITNCHPWKASRKAPLDCTLIKKSGF